MENTSITQHKIFREKLQIRRKIMVVVTRQSEKNIHYMENYYNHSKK